MNVKLLSSEDARLLASPSEKIRKEQERLVEMSLKRLFALIASAANSGAHEIEVAHITEWEYRAPLGPRETSIAVTILNNLRELGYSITQERHIGGKTIISWKP